MTSLPLIFACSAMVAAGLASIAVWAPRKLTPKVLALSGFAAFLPLSFAGWADLLSRPKPVSMEWVIGQQDATVLSGIIQENVGIFVWLQLAGAAEPRSYVLPYDKQTAQQLQDAQRKASGEGEEGESGTDEGQGKVKMRFQRSLDTREPLFYDEPVPALPLKPNGGQAPAEVFVPEQSA